MLYFLKLVVIAVVTLPAVIVTIAIGLFDPYGKYVYEIGRCWTWLVLRVGGVSVKTYGLDNLDPKGQYIFMVNHQSNIDIPVLVQSLPAFQLRWIAKKELLWVPLFGWAMWAAKHIPVDRADRLGALGRLKKAKERMKAGISVVFFPEGTRSTDGKLLPFKRGGFLLALQTQTAIVPVTINGSGAILPKGDWRIRSGQVEVSVGEPISVEDYRPGSLRALSAEVQVLIGEKLRTACNFTKEAASAAQPMRAPRSPTEEPTG
jgi:1-acyl-sn-glycerol-3-phosphate acyltransferase